MTCWAKAVHRFVLAGCEPAMPQGKPSAEPSIEGEWTVTEYLVWNYTSEWIDDELIEEWEQVDHIDTYAITLTFTADRYVHTFDPPYRGETSAITGRYELLADSRILFENHPDGASVARYSVDASTLTLRAGPANREAVLTATRATR